MRHAHSLAVLTFLLTACGTGRPVAMTASTVSPGDRAWLAAIRQSGHADIQYGRLAERKGATAAVRQAGSMLAADHGALDRKVTRVAEDLGVDLPETERQDQFTLAQRLAREPGGRFDRDFVAAEVAQHEKAVADAEEEARTGSAPEVTALAREALAMLRGHLGVLRRASPVG